MAVDEEVEQPVIFFAAGFVGQFREAYHGSAVIKCIGNPGEPAWTDVGFGERDGCDGSIIGEEALLFRVDCQAQSCLPVVARHFADDDFGHRIVPVETIQTCESAATIGGSASPAFERKITSA